MRTRLPRRGWLLALVGFWAALCWQSPVLAEDFEAQPLQNDALAFYGQAARPGNPSDCARVSI